MKILAVFLAVLGIIVLAYSGLTFTTPGKPLEFLGISIATTNSHFIPPVAGAIALAVGVALLVVRRRPAG